MYIYITPPPFFSVISLYILFCTNATQINVVLYRCQKYFVHKPLVR